MAKRFGNFHLRVSCLSQKRPILLTLLLRFLWLWLWFAFRKLLYNIFGYNFLQKLEIELALVGQFLECVDIDGFVLDVVGDGAEGKPKKGLIDE